jgi:hypothetical protein
MTWSRMKFEGRDSGGKFSPGSFAEEEFAAFMLLLFYMGKMDSRRSAAAAATSLRPLAIGRPTCRSAMQLDPVSDESA